MIVHNHQVHGMVGSVRRNVHVKVPHHVRAQRLETRKLLPSERALDVFHMSFLFRGTVLQFMNVDDLARLSGVSRVFWHQCSMPGVQRSLAMRLLDRLMAFPPLTNDGTQAHGAIVLRVQQHEAALRSLQVLLLRDDRAHKLTAGSEHNGHLHFQREFAKWFCQHRASIAETRVGRLPAIMESSSVCRLPCFSVQQQWKARHEAEKFVRQHHRYRRPAFRKLIKQELTRLYLEHGFIADKYKEHTGRWL